MADSASIFGTTPAAVAPATEYTPRIPDGQPASAWLIVCSARSDDDANGDWDLLLRVRVPGGLYFEYIEHDPHEFWWDEWDAVVRGDDTDRPLVVRRGMVVLRMNAGGDSHLGIAQSLGVAIPHAAIAGPLAVAIADAKRRGLVTQDVKTVDVDAKSVKEGL
jgi:hypothetical protein